MGNGSCGCLLPYSLLHDQRGSDFADLASGGKLSLEGVIRSDWLRGPGPWIFTGLKMGSVIGLATLLGVEMHTSTRGLGFEIVVAMANLNLVRAYVGMFAAALVMYALWLCLTSIELMWTKSSMT